MFRAAGKQGFCLRLFVSEGWPGLRFIWLEFNGLRWPAVEVVTDHPLEKIVSGWGVCPLPPVASDNLSALGRTNDAILYGSTVLCNLRDEDEILDSLVKQVPSCSSGEYGRPFEEVFKSCGNFYDIDPLSFSPAEVWLCNLNSSRSFHAGALRIVSTSPTVISLRPNYTMRFYKGKEIGEETTSLKA